VKEAENLDTIGLDSESDAGALAVIRDPNAGPNVVPARSPFRERCQLFAVAEERVGVADRCLRRGCSRYVAVEVQELLLGFRSEDDPLRH
jgi:hypothetical protein